MKIKVKFSEAGNIFAVKVQEEDKTFMANFKDVVMVNSSDSSQNVDLTGYATEEWVRDGYQPKGDYLTAVPDGYAKTDDIPVKPEDIGAQPAGNYLTEVPSGYATEEFVLNKIAEAELGGEEVDLSVYAHKSELPTKTSQLTNDSGFLTEHQDLSGYVKKTEMPDIPVQSVNGKTGAVSLNAYDVGARPSTWMPTAQEVGALPSTYVPPNQTAEQVGADPKGTANTAVSWHNTSSDSHGDIRVELKAINDRLIAFFDSDDQTLDELSEIVAYITSNKTLIDSITTNKVNVADIINNLTTNVVSKPLSAAQGVALKGLIDGLTDSLSNYQPRGDYALTSEIPVVPMNVSAFINDAGYLTEHQDLSGYALKTEIPSVLVKSVNGRTGAVQLTASDVNARPSSWTPTYSDVGADKSGTAATVVSNHNTNTAAHNDIRLLIEGLSTRINALANSTDVDLDQMAEVVAYIKNNKSLIDGVTTSKVNVADIINNLTTNVANKPLSAAQGVMLKELIDTVSDSLSGYQSKGDYAMRSELPTKPSDIGAQPMGNYLTSYTETDPTVPEWAKSSTKPSYTKSEVGLGNVDNVKQYSASNPPPYPVTSVNNKTGAVQLSAADVGARPSTWMPSASDVGALPASTTIPSKTSQLTNDSGYQTANQVTAIVQQQLGVIENGTY